MLIKFCWKAAAAASAASSCRTSANNKRDAALQEGKLRALPAGGARAGVFGPGLRLNRRAGVRALRCSRSFCANGGHLLGSQVWRAASSSRKQPRVTLPVPTLLGRGGEMKGSQTRLLPLALQDATCSIPRRPWSPRAERARAEGRASPAAERTRGSGLQREAAGLPFGSAGLILEKWPDIKAQ